MDNNDAAKMDNDKKSVKTSTTGSSYNVRKEEEPSMCCCCVCNLTPHQTRDLTCCCCIPIRCGVQLVGVVTAFLLLFLFIDIGYGLLNEHIDWWHVMISVALLTPLIIGVAFFVVFFSRETRHSRGRLFTACMLVIISVTTVAVWNTIYFHWIYKNDAVYTGTSDIGYIKQTKKQFIVWQLYIACIIDAFYAYFICMTRAYSNRMNKKNAKEPEAMMDALMNPSSNDNAPKDDMEAMEGDEMGQEGE
jgi:TRAP-type C4-dicarboxylate transport system permease small subunit